MVRRNTNVAKLRPYVFSQVNERKKELLEKNPGAKLINLGIGDTTEPLPPYITNGLSKAAEGLGTDEGYSGYGPQPGNPILRKKVAEKIFNGLVSPEDVFISDGSKCDIARIQTLIGGHVSVAIQDPSYPVYVDTSVIAGQTGDYDPAQNHYRGIEYLPCIPENDFFPDLKKVRRTDIVFFCSPNNPTGAVATREQLKQLVSFVKNNKSLLIYDAAYAMYIQDDRLPRSIYEIAGAEEVAIEVGSFSKIAGFTGVRLGWTIVPEKLKYEDGSSVRSDWLRVVTSCFNGASNIAQYGGIAALEEKGFEEMQSMVKFYLENAKIMKESLTKFGIEACGGTNSPYVWAKFPGKTSWEAFDDLFENLHIITTPGSGFGIRGEGFLRFSGYNHRHTIEEAMRKIESHLKINKS